MHAINIPLASLQQFSNITKVLWWKALIIHVAEICPNMVNVETASKL
jgi:hypothetical protein